MGNVENSEGGGGRGRDGRVSDLFVAILRVRATETGKLRDILTDRPVRSPRLDGAPFIDLSIVAA
jgi:hypothetical protein